MNADAMATRMSVLNRALPRRILIVDDDELNLDLLSDRLRTAGFDVERAMNGEEALGRLQQQWFPVVITDWQMPVMDGIALTQALRARGVDDTYVIMLTMREAGPDYERGYLAGVDDYLTKRLPDAELFARIHVAFNTLALRRSLKEARDALEHNAPITPIDADSSAFTTQELQSRLQSEIKRAQRYGRQLSVMTMGMSGAAQSLTAETLQSIVRTLRTVIRSDVDWIGRMAGTNNDVTFAIVLPEAGSADGPAIKSRLEDALLPFAAGNQPVSFRFGFASVQRTDMGAHIGGEAVDAGDLLGVAGQCRGCPGHAGAEQLSTVQFSIKSHVAIACRHGYSVDRYCTLKTATAAVNRPFAASTRTH
jgi:DNA-binding response OmpR family regulator